MVFENGTVKWFDHHRGYGFIAQETGEDVFFHFAAIRMDGYRWLREGIEVCFEVERGARGLRAVSVWAR